MKESPQPFSGVRVPDIRRDGELSPQYKHGSEIGDPDLAGFTDLIDRMPVKELVPTPEPESLPELSDIDSKPALNNLRTLLQTSLDSRQIGSYALYIHNIGPSKITAALEEAGYTPTEADKLEQQMFSPKIFAGDSDPAFIANQVKRKLQEVYKLALEHMKLENIPAPALSEQLKNDSDQETVAVPPEENLSNVAYRRLVPQFANDPVDENLIVNKVEVNSPKVESEPFVLTQEMRVEKNNPEPIIVDNDSKQSVENKDLREYEQILQNLESSPEISSEKYLEFIYDLHAQQRALYDNVLQEARTSLKRFSSDYTPTQAEKQGLQYLSSMQAYHAKMSVIRGNVTAALESNADIDTIKELSREYFEKCQKLTLMIEHLRELIDTSKTEERPPKAEGFRNQLESLRVKVNRMATNFSDENHPLFLYFKTVQNQELPDLIKTAAAENGGNIAFLESVGNFTSLRDRITALISYLEAEHNYLDFVPRANGKMLALQTLLNKVSERSNLSNLEQEYKEALAKNLTEIREKMAENITPPMPNSSEDTFNGKADNLKNLILQITSQLAEAKVMAEEFGESEQMESPVEVSNPSELDDKKYGVTKEMFELLTLRREQLRNSAALKSEREASVKNLKAYLSKSFTKIGKAVAIAVTLMSAAPEKVDSNSPVDGYNSLSTADVLGSYLRAEVPGVNTVEDNPPTIPDYQPTELPKAPVTYSGVKIISPQSESLTSPDDSFSKMATQVQVDPGIEFNSGVSAEGAASLYSVQYGDKFWTMAEGRTLAGMLPSMKLVKEDKIQQVIEYMRAAIDTNSAVREKTGLIHGASKLGVGQFVNMTELDALLLEVASNRGYLK